MSESSPMAKCFYRSQGGRMRRWGRRMLMCALVAAGFYYANSTGMGGVERIVRVELSDEIRDIHAMRRMAALLDDTGVKGILLVANSPGGSPAISEAWARVFARFQEKHVPVVSITYDICTSGCYLAIAGSDRIISYHTSILGSIGAVMMAPNFAQWIKKHDVHVDVIKSGPLKAEPHILSELREAYREAMEHVVNDTGRWFVDYVLKARKIHSPAVEESLKSGAIFLAPQALRMQLIDALGDEKDAMEALYALLKRRDLPIDAMQGEEGLWWKRFLGVHAWQGGWRPSLLWMA